LISVKSFYVEVTGTDSEPIEFLDTWELQIGIWLQPQDPTLLAL